MDLGVWCGQHSGTEKGFKPPPFGPPPVTPGKPRRQLQAPMQLRSRGPPVSSIVSMGLSTRTCLTSEPIGSHS